MEEAYKILLQRHTPEELRLSSNLVHWIVGGVFGIVAIVSIVQIFGYLKHRALQYFPPILVLATSIVLLLYLFFHHGLDQIGRVWQLMLIDPQQRQHVFMALLLIISSITELLWKIKQRGVLWQLVWPSVITIIGVMFLLHPQHGTKEAIAWSKSFHTYLGIVLILTGLLKSIDVGWGRKAKWLSFSWTIMLLVASVLLLSFREPEEAYALEAMEYHVSTTTDFAKIMSIDKVLVAIFSVVGIVFTYWFFLMKKEKVVSVTDSVDSAGSPQVDIIVEGGYTPSVISIPKGKSTKINFIRKDSSSCLEEVVLSDFKIRRFLPLNKKVTIELLPQKTGEFRFECGMNMFHGKIIVK